MKLGNNNDEHCDELEAFPRMEGEEARKSTLYAVDHLSETSDASIFYINTVINEPLPHSRLPAPVAATQRIPDADCCRAYLIFRI